MKQAANDSFWLWFTHGSGGKPGFVRLLGNWWSVLHLVVGVILAAAVPTALQNVADVVLGPLLGILVGLTFAWAGNALGLLQSREMQALGDEHMGGFQEYVNTYQMAILVVLSTVGLWGMSAVGVFDLSILGFRGPQPYFLGKALLFATLSLSVRECWHAINGARLMVLMQKRIRDRNERRACNIEQKT